MLAALVFGGAVLRGRLPRPVPGRAGLAFLVLLGGFVAWTGVSISWSIQPDRSWAYLNRGLVYLAFAALGLLVGAAVPRAPRLVVAGLAVILAAALGWALLGKVFPGLYPEGARIARLRNPVGYWNGLALLGDLALPLLLWASARRRILGPVGLYGTIVAIALTYSRGGVVAGAVAVALWLAVGHGRRESLRALALALPAALAVSGIALALPGVVKDFQPHATRVRDGAWFGVALVLGAALVAGLARVASRRELPARPLAALLAAVALGGVVGLAVRGDFSREFGGSHAQVTQDPNRLASLSSNQRWTWWQDAWSLFENRPLLGQGAGSFELARRPIRRDALVTVEPHNVALQFLSETGLAGFALAGGAAVAALLAVRRRLGDPAAAALAVFLPVYLLHALDDFDWDFIAVSAPLFLVAGVLATGPPARPGRRGLLPLAAAAALAAAVLYSLLSPWLATRRVNESYDALARGAYAQAAADARSARSLNPFSVEPLWAWAGAEDARGDAAGALRLYRRAADLQPENSSAWYDLGAYELTTGHVRDAYTHLDRAYGLDRYGPAGLPGGLLDQARAKVNAGEG